jgi:hypothetical protein
MNATKRVGAVLAAAGAAVAVGAGSAAAAVAPMTVTVDPAGTANPGNTATVSGTVTCPLGNVFYGYAQVRPPGRVPNATSARGLFGDSAHPIACTGAPQPWLVTTTPAAKPFVPGPAEVQAVFSTQGPAGLNTVQVFQPVVLV